MTDSTNEFGSGEFGGQFGASLSANVKSLIDDVLRAGGVLITDDTYRKRALVFANQVYRTSLQGKHWNFTHRELQFDMQAPYGAGTVTLTQGDSTVVEDLDTDASPITQWNGSMKGRMFCPTSRVQDYYRILKINDSKSLEIDNVWPEDTATVQSYQILADTYVIDVKASAIKNVSVNGVGRIKLIGRQSFRTMKMKNPCLTGFPEWGTVTGMEADTGQIKMEFYPAPDKRYAAHLEYTERPVTLEDSESCFPLIPPEHMPVLFYGTLAEIYRFQNNAAMASEYGKMFARALTKMSSDHNMTDPVARIQHRRKYFQRRRHRYPGYYGLNWFGKVDD